MASSFVNLHFSNVPLGISCNKHSRRGSLPFLYLRKLHLFG